MIRARRIEAYGAWQAPPAGRVMLDSADRRRRRYMLRTMEGLEFLLDLEHTPLLGDGDALVLDDGRRIAVVAASEPLTEVRGGSPAHLAQLAYHIGNRHLDAQIGAERIVIRRDHVIEEMLRGLGAEVLHVEEAFDPLSGAYGGGHHGHD